MTKHDVLEILSKEKNGYVSGEKISKIFNVSRAAVNAAVRALRLDGFDILSSTNKGYCLKSIPDIISKETVAKYLPPERVSAIRFNSTVGSTNNLLRDMAFEGACDGSAVVAEEQTAGRGRSGRDFLSPKGKGIYISYLFRPDDIPAGVSSITAWTAVAVCRALFRLCNIKPGIKWVNDLVLNSKKLCGILTELSVESESGHIQHIIIGIGLNTGEDRTDFTGNLSNIATSLRIETGKVVCRAELTAEIIKELDKMCNGWPFEKQSYLHEYRENCITVGKDISIVSNGVERTGKAIRVNDDFSLHVAYSDGTESDLKSGEVSVRGLCGYV